MSDSPVYASRPIISELTSVLKKLTPGQRIRVTQIVRVGMKSWPAIVTGAFRRLDSLATGLATQRVVHDDVVVPIVHFTKENGEASSVALDENTKIEILA